MMVHICDWCNTVSEETMLVLEGLDLRVKGTVQYGVGLYEFCSFHCMQQFLINGIKQKGLEEFIRV